MNEWRAAVERAGELFEYPNPDPATASFEIEDDSGLESAWFHADDVPAPLRPIAALVERWGSKRSRWTAEDLELWMLAKMRGPRVEAALVQLGRSRDDMRQIAEALAAVFEGPGYDAAEYARILGAPRATRPSPCPARSRDRRATSTCCRCGPTSCSS